jgi:hypothetical protein
MVDAGQNRTLRAGGFLSRGTHDAPRTDVYRPMSTVRLEASILPAKGSATIVMRQGADRALRDGPSMGERGARTSPKSNLPGRAGEIDPFKETNSV